MQITTNGADGDDCIGDFSDSSAAAPFVSGALALALQAKYVQVYLKKYRYTKVTTDIPKEVEVYLSKYSYTEVSTGVPKEVQVYLRKYRCTVSTGILK